MATLPPLNDDQTIKLKQLTIMAMAETLKVLSYESLMASLDISSLRELEDLLISGCIYTGVVKGKLNQEKRQFEVHFSKGRDVPFEQVYSGWCASCLGGRRALEECVCMCVFSRCKF